MGWFSRITDYLRNPLDLGKDLISRPLGPLGPTVVVPGVNYPLNPANWHMTFAEFEDIIKIEAVGWLCKLIWKDKYLENVDTHVFNLNGDWSKRQQFVNAAMFGAVMAPTTDSTGSSFVQTYLVGPGIAIRSYDMWARKQNYNYTDHKTGQLTVYQPFAKTLMWTSAGFQPTPRLDRVKLAQIISAEYENAPVTISEAAEGPSDLRYWIIRHLIRYHPDIAYSAVLSDSYDKDSHTYYVVINGEKEEVDITDYTDGGIYLFAVFSLSANTYADDVWIYKIGSGNAAADALVYNSGSSEFDYLPFIPLRVNGKFVDDPTVTELANILPQVKKAITKAYPGTTLDKIMKTLKKDPLENIIAVYLSFGVALNSKNKRCRSYLFEFFKEMLTSVQKDNSLTFGSMATSEESAMLAGLEYLDTQASQLYADKDLINSFNRWHISVSADSAQLPVFATTWGSSMINVNQGLQWHVIEHSQGVGKGEPNAKVGDCWWAADALKSSYGWIVKEDPEAAQQGRNTFYCTRLADVVDEDGKPTGKLRYVYPSDDFPYTDPDERQEGVHITTETLGGGVLRVQVDISHRFEAWVEDNDGSGGSTKHTYQSDFAYTYLVTPDTSNVNVVRIIKQTTPTSWEAYTIYGLVFLDNVMRNNVIAIDAKSAIRNVTSESAFIIPLHGKIMRNISLVDATQVALESGYIVLNSYVVTKVPWFHQSSFYTTVFVIVLIVVTIVSWGTMTGQTAATGAGLLGTYAAVGAALGYAATEAILVGYIANMIAAYIFISILTKMATNMFGAKVGAVVGVIAAIYVGNMSGAQASANTAFSVGELMNVRNLMTLLTSVGDALTKYEQECTKDVAERSKELMADYNTKEAAINKKVEEIFGQSNPLVAPGVVTDTLISRIESPDSFLGRTLMTGSDLAELSIGGIHNLSELTLSTDLP